MNLKDKHTKKSEQYTSAQTYRDLDGNMRNFTMIDHDRKTSINTTVIKEEEKGEAAKAVDEYRKSLQQKILLLPASLCPHIFMDFTVRGENTDVITWNEKMVLDNGVPTQQLSDLYTLLSNRNDMVLHRVF